MAVEIASHVGEGSVFDCGAGIAPPSLWYTSAFDDSTWAAPVAGGTAGAVLPTDAQWISYNSDLSGQSEHLWLYRRSFDLPSDALTAVALEITADDYVMDLYINGMHIYGLGTASQLYNVIVTVPINAAQLNIGGSNLLAVSIQNGGGDTLNPTSFAFHFLTQTAVDEGTTSGQADAGTSGFGAQLANAARVRHASGVLAWEHDGVLWRVRSRDRTVLQTPFPVMAGQPVAVLGQDPVTGLPMWSGYGAPPAVAPPPPVSHTYAQPDLSVQDTASAPDPLPVPPTPQRVCGAANNMASLLCAVYDAIVALVNKAKDSIIADFTQILKDEVQGEIVSLMTEAEFAQFEIDGIQIALSILAAIVQTLLSWGTKLPSIVVPSPDDLGDSIFQVVRCCAFQALWLTGGDYFSHTQSADGLSTRDYWQQYLNADWSFFAGSTVPGVGLNNLPWQVRWLDAIIANTPDAAWARAAWVGAQRPQSTCTACAGYPT